MHQPHASSTGPAPGPIGPVDMATPIEHMETRQKHIEEEQARIERDRTEAINRLAALRYEGRDSKNASFTRRQPVVTANAVSGLILGALAAGGFALTQDQLTSLDSLVAAGLVLGPPVWNYVTGLVARKNTTYL